MMYHRRMSMPPAHHAFLQRATQEGCEEVSFIDGRVSAIRGRRVDVPRVTRKSSAIEALRRAAGWLLKNGARLVYIAPVLLVAKLVLNTIDENLSGLMIVVFVAIVAVFFALLNLYIFMSVLWWLLGRDPKSLVLEAPFRGEGREALPLLSRVAQGSVGDPVELGAAHMPAGQAVWTRGVITRLGPNLEGDGTVVRDLWSDDGAFRLAEVIDFAVTAPGKLPAVVRLTEAPLVVAEPSATRFGDAMSQASSDTARLFEHAGIDAKSAGATECSRLTLREGDEVEVIGVVLAGIDNVDGFELEGTYASVPLTHAEGGDAGTPFRDRPGGPGVILGGQVVLKRYGA